MVKWFTLKNKEGGKINLPPFIYFYSVEIDALDGFIDLILSIVSLLQPFILIEVNEAQPSNILLISVTLLISQPLKFKDVRLVQLLNILFILVTLLVSHLLKSKDVRPSQP